MMAAMRMTIGEFAAAGRVSVRALRHYDERGLLRPAQVDPRTGYRSYERAHLGFSLEQVGALLAHDVSVAELRGMLRLRRAELEHDIATHQQRLVEVEARLRHIEQEHDMTEPEITVKAVDPLHVASTSDRAASFDPADITAVIVPLYPRLFDRLAAADVAPVGLSIAWYEMDPGGTDQVVVHAGVPVADEITVIEGLDVVDLPALSQVASIVHRGAPDSELGFDGSYHALLRYAEAHGYVAVGFSREIYLDCPADRDRWVTELQFALELPS
jgi:DNA-binding transcriptional MerR regulator